MTRNACLAALSLLAAGCSNEASPPPEGDGAAIVEPGEIAETGERQRSRYTRLTDCRLTRSAPEEAGFFEHECPGEGGYRLRHTEADLRESVTVLAPDGGEHGLELSSLANGAFSSVGETAEWRGRDSAEGFVPTALILRHSVMEDPDPRAPEVSYLVVAKLAPQPCVIARVPPGPDQNPRAREMADAGGVCLASFGSRRRAPIRSLRTRPGTKNILDNSF